MPGPAAFLVALTLVAAFACRGTRGLTGLEFRITGHGTEEPGAFCADFRLTDDEARQFFQRASQVTEKQLHDEYDWLPCYVEGTRTEPGGRVTHWRVRAGGTAEIKAPEGVISYLGCKTCDDLLK